MGARGRQPATPSGANPGADYAAWLAVVPVEQRERIAVLVREHVISDYKSFSTFSQKVMAELFAGNITPEVAREARFWAELMLTAIAAENSAKGTPEQGANNIMLALVQTFEASQSLTPAYKTPEKIRVLDAENE